MAVDLTRPAGQVNLGDNQYKNLLDNLQANILSSHGRDHARHLFIRFTGAPAAVRGWIAAKVAPAVTSAAEQRKQAKELDEAKKAGNSFDGGLVTGFFLSAAGYRFLDFNPDALSSSGFRKGMKDRSKYVGPDLVLGINLRLKNRDPEPAAWETGFRDEVHALITLADDGVEGSLTRLLNTVESYKAEIGGGIGVLTHIQEGRVLRRPVPNHPGEFEPIEHFGYFDGISQPLFTQAELGDYDAKQRRPRQAGDWDPAASLDLILAEDPFSDAPDAYGSYLVYRKLEQDYAEFEKRVKALAAAVPASEELAGAYVVGRFKDGTPVSMEAAPNSDLFTENHFLHSDDDDGLKCPMHAHIRKANPRGTTPGTSLKDEAARRIARRGIPYGKPHPDLQCDPDEFPSQEAGPRGLLFLCFQANIEDHFEFIQRVWIDNNEFPKGINPFGSNTGDDPLIGQDLEENQRWPQAWNNEDAGSRKFNFEAAVTLKGGEYFFAPSIPFLAAG